MKRQIIHPDASCRPRAPRGFFSTFVCLSVLALLFLCGCGKKEQKEVRNYVSTPADFNAPNYVIGIVSETNSGFEAKKVFSNAKFREFETISDAYPALENGTIHGIAYDRPVLEYAQRSRDVFVVMPDNYADGHVAIAVPESKPELLQTVNAFLQEYFTSGLYDNMYARWIKSSNPEMPKIPVPINPYGKLVIGTENTNEPMSFTDSDGSPAGFDIELAYRLGAALNMAVELKVMPYLDLYTAVEKSEVDLAIASMDKFEGDNRNILFSENYINSPAAIMTRKNLYKPEGESGNSALKSPQDLAGSYAAILMGSKYAADCKDLLPDTKFILAENRESACALLISNKIDSMLMEEPLARSCIAMFPEIQIASIVKRESYSFALPQQSPLYRSVNRIIAELKDTGELVNLAAKWCSAEPGKQEFEKLFDHDDVPRVNGVLRYATTPGATPLCFMGADGSFLGLEIEIMRRAAHDFGMEFQVIPAPHEMLFDLLRSGQVDVVGGMLTPDADNTDGIEFSEAYYEGGATIVTNIPHGEYVFGITKLNQLAGKRIGVLPFTYAAAQLDEKLPDAIPFYCSQERDLFYLLGTDKIDALIISEPRSRAYLPLFPQFIQIPEFVTRTDYSFFFSTGKRPLCEAFSRQIRTMKKNGMLNGLQNKWLSPTGAQASLPQAAGDAPNGVLRMGVIVNREPFSFMHDEKFAGYDLETAQRAAAAMGFLVEFVRLNSEEFEQALTNGLVDFGASEISEKTTSSGKLIYSEPHYNGGLIIVVQDKKKARPVHMALIPQIKFFLKEQAFSLHRSLWKDNHMRKIFDGFRRTLIITAAAVFFGTILGIPLCMLRQSKRKRYSIPADIVCALLYNIPILILLMGMYYVVLRRFGFRPMVAAIVIFILRFMAASCRLYMITLQHIGGVQLDAARALCLRRMTFFRRVILPQAAAFLAKPFREEIIRLVELTTVVGYISVWDLTKTIDWIRGRTYESFFPIAFATLLYFLLSMCLIAAISLLSKRFETSVWKRKPVANTPVG
ncbi:MAG: transporter substrate-binding domain-containing protein [Lentisphaeria bacterium]|nr:transporter substrate-binding domain-containing protein [Lentisphaeria bacterium]